MKTLFYIIIITLCLTGLATILFLPKEFIARIQALVRKLRNRNTTSNVKPIDNALPKASHLAKVQYDFQQKAKEQFINNQNKFFGIYENLYLVVEAGTESAQCNLSDWETRIVSLSNASELQDYWHSVRHRPTEFLDFVCSCGVIRESRRIVTADESTQYRYYELDGATIVPEQDYEVLQPCWYNGDLLLEKGILKKQ